jgi:cellulose synthase/poly-beta-1,6-N-acetylglucosamine synthase-like glycosyltransferase
MPLWISLGLFFVIVVFGNIFEVIGPVTGVKSNSRFHSAIKPNLKLARSQGFEPPPITIQMPIYTESLEGVVKPTVASLQAAISYYESRGGSARIFMNDDGMAIRSEEDNKKFREFYVNNNIGWVSRPKHNHEGFVRRGKFKKASNMNFALNITNRVEDELQKLVDGMYEQGATTITEELEDELYQQALDTILVADPRAKAGGNIRMGEYILIVDSDTIVPEDCLMYGAAEMFLSPEVAIVQHATGVMQVSWDYFENGITYFTNLVYTAIRFSVGSGEVAPFVGHNAFLRWQAIQV